jgi:adenylate cyclase
MRGWALARPSQQTKEKNEAARTLFEQALKIDPDNPDALSGEAYTYSNEFSIGSRSPETDYDAKILGPTDRAIALAPDTFWAYYVKCVYLYYSHRADKAIDAANAGLAINPNFPLWGVRGIANLFDGHFEQARSDIIYQQKLSPAIRSQQSRPSIWATRHLGWGNWTPPSETTTRQLTSA